MQESPGRDSGIRRSGVSRRLRQIIQRDLTRCDRLLLSPWRLFQDRSCLSRECSGIRDRSMYLTFLQVRIRGDDLGDTVAVSYHVCDEVGRNPSALHTGRAGEDARIRLDVACRVPAQLVRRATRRVLAVRGHGQQPRFGHIGERCCIVDRRQSSTVQIGCGADLLLFTKLFRRTPGCERRARTFQSRYCHLICQGRRLQPSLWVPATNGQCVGFTSWVLRADRLSLGRGSPSIRRPSLRLRFATCAIRRGQS